MTISIKTKPKKGKQEEKKANVSENICFKKTRANVSENICFKKTRLNVSENICFNLENPLSQCI